MVGAAGVPKRTVIEGRVYLSRLAVAEALGRSTRTVKRLEKRGVLRPLQDLNGIADGRWYPETEVETLRRIAEQTRYLDGHGSFDAFVEAVADWRDRETATETGGAGTARPWHHQRRLANLTQYAGEEWVPPSERRVAMQPCCPHCGKPTHQITDQWQRLTGICSNHGRVTPVQVPLPVQDGTRWGDAYQQAPPAQTSEPPRRQRAGRLRPEHLGAVQRIAKPVAAPRPLYLPPYEGPTHPS